MTTAKERRRNVLVYPNENVQERLGGWGSSLFNICLECWASQIEKKAKQLDGQLDEQEWRILSEVTRHYGFQPQAYNNAELIASTLEGRHAEESLGCEYFGDTANGKVKLLTNKVRKLDYAGSWAVILACWFFHNYQSEIEAGDRWWSVEYRKEFFRRNHRTKNARWRRPWGGG